MGVSNHYIPRMTFRCPSDAPEWRFHGNFHACAHGPFQRPLLEKRTVASPPSSVPWERWLKCHHRTRGAEWHWVWSRYLHVLSSAQSPNLGNIICLKNIYDAIRMFYAQQKTVAGIVSMLVQIIMQYHLEVSELWQLSAQPPGGTGGYWAEPDRLYQTLARSSDSGLVMIIRIVIGMINIAESLTEVLNWKKHIFTMQTQVSIIKSMLKTSHKPILT